MILAALITIVFAAAGQLFAYQAGLHRANADWHGWMADGWRIYLRTGNTLAAFGNGRPAPRLASCRLYDWERDGI